MKGHNPPTVGSYDPERLKAVLKAYDAAWAQIASGIGTRPKAIVAARMMLADVALSVAENGIHTPAEMTATALKIMLEEPTQIS